VKWEVARSRPSVGEWDWLLEEEDEDVEFRK
jgi:hypothetical protein